MEERIEDLYYSYLKPKLDLVFDFECEEHKALTLGPNRYGRANHGPKDVAEVEQEDYGPHGDYTRFHLYVNGKKVDTSSEKFKVFYNGFYFADGEIRKNGKKIASANYNDEMTQSIDGISIIKTPKHRVYNNGWDTVPDKYKLLTDKGYLCGGKEFDYAYTIGYGYTIVGQKNHYNVLDGSGKPIFGKWTKDKDKISYNNSFITLEDESYPIVKELLDYKVEKKPLINRYVCDNGVSKFTVAFNPVRIYNYRFSLGYVKNKVFIYDCALNKYKELGLTNNLEFSEKDPFIIDKENDKAYMVYEDKVLDISRYYKEHLKSGAGFSINKGVRGIMTYDEFSFRSMDEIDEIITDEAKKNVKIKHDIEEQKKNEAFEEEKKKKEQEEKELIELEEKAIRQIQEGLEILQIIEAKRPLQKKIKLNSNMFIEYPDHLEFRPEIIPILRIIDLSLDGFEEIKMDNIDFRGTNLSFNPQTVYNRTLRNSNFEGVFISPWANFSGIDIRGCKFSKDNDDRTIDFFNSSFKRAIYDETTTYNGIPLTQLIKKEEENNNKSKI